MPRLAVKSQRKSSEDAEKTNAMGLKYAPENLRCDQLVSRTRNARQSFPASQTGQNPTPVALEALVDENGQGTSRRQGDKENQTAFVDRYEQKQNRG